MDDKVDRRVVKTKERLYRVFVDLLAEKPIKDITVKELAEKADINRATFYLHYNDVFDLLEQIEDEIIRKFDTACGNLSMNFTDREFKILFRQLLDFIRENQKLCRTLFGKNGDRSFFERLVQIIMTKYMFIGENSKYTVSFIIAGCVGVIINWIKTDMEESSENVAELVMSIVRKINS